MKSRLRFVLLLSAFAVIFAVSSASFAQIKVGGYKVVKVDDAAAVAAADFAVEAQTDKTGMDIELGEIVKAERQIVQGSNYRLCMMVSSGGDEAFYVQAVVYQDLKRAYRLTSWTDSKCGETAIVPLVQPIMVGGFSKAPKTDAQVIAAANFATSAQSKKEDAEFSVDEIVKAERQVVQGMNYRICMRVNVEGDEPIMVTASVYQDLKRKYTLSIWKVGPCKA